MAPPRARLSCGDCNHGRGVLPAGRSSSLLHSRARNAGHQQSAVWPRSAGRVGAGCAACGGRSPTPRWWPGGPWGHPENLLESLHGVCGAGTEAEPHRIAAPRHGAAGPGPARRRGDRGQDARKVCRCARRQCPRTRIIEKARKLRELLRMLSDARIANFVRAAGSECHYLLGVFGAAQEDRDGGIGGKLAGFWLPPMKQQCAWVFFPDHVFCAGLTCDLAAFCGFSNNR